jgi:Arc/MetJ-type ribon-helix-helix transcriptional regulator
MPETEKLTINLNPVDLGQIELLVDQGFYANRAEFIRSAIAAQLTRHARTVREATSRYGLVVGAMTFGRRELERHRESGKRLSLKVVGYLSIADDVPAELAREAIEAVSVRGIFKASREVKDALADRTA